MLAVSLWGSPTLAQVLKSLCCFAMHLGTARRHHDLSLVSKLHVGCLLSKRTPYAATSVHCLHIAAAVGAKLKRQKMPRVMLLHLSLTPTRISNQDCCSFQAFNVVELWKSFCPET
ncbi:hypothetical protein IWX46DRAFT_94517 [Phyllosticta citricarpa]|uniref:Secreted protein n=1 Tax=Phyllosticta citricarpa TaxID=55181 RepID=A0ABR1MCI4_9PEZI